MGAAAAKEPTMEDILSSIRKIISEEGDPAPEEAVAENPLDKPVEIEAEDKPASLQQLAKQMASQDQTEPSADAVKGSSLSEIAAKVKTQNAAASSPSPDVAKELSQPPRAVEPPKMETKVEMANATPAPVSVQRDLSTTPSPAKSAPVESAPVARPPVNAEAKSPSEEEKFRGALMSPSSDNSVTDSFDRLKRSVMDDLEAKTEAVLRPMLREWLDENLPNMVERLVREEIERVARGV